MFPGFVPMFQRPAPLIWDFFFFGIRFGVTGVDFGALHLNTSNTSNMLSNSSYLAIAFHSSFGGFHLIFCLLLQVKDNYMLSHLQKSGISLEWCLHHLTFLVTDWFGAFACLLCFCVHLRTGFVASGIGSVLTDQQFGLFFIGVETLMGFVVALCGDIPRFFCLPVFYIISAAIEATGDSLLTVIRFF